MGWKKGAGRGGLHEDEGVASNTPLRETNAERRQRLVASREGLVESQNTRQVERSTACPESKEREIGWKKQMLHDLMNCR